MLKFTFMKDRIIKFLKEMNLTSTKFADEIGVQRSSISHILSGRNKPSFDFIEKMLIAYPDIDAQWLITGKGTMNSDQPSLFNQQKDDIKQNYSTALEFNNQNSVPHNPQIDKSQEQINHSKQSVRKFEKEIERVMIFYTDGTFGEYKSH